MTESWPVSQSRAWVNAASPLWDKDMLVCAHTCTAWLRDLHLVHCHCTISVCSLTGNNMSDFVNRLFSHCAAHRHPHIHTQFFFGNDKDIDIVLEWHTIATIFFLYKSVYQTCEYTWSTHFVLFLLTLIPTFLLFRSSTRRNTRRQNHSLTTTSSPLLRILCSDSSDMLAPSSVT